MELIKITSDDAIYILEEYKAEYLATTDWAENGAIGDRTELAAEEYAAEKFFEKYEIVN